MRRARILYLESITSEDAAFQERTEWRLRKMGLEEDRKPSILMGGIAWSAAPDNPGFRGVKT